MLDGLAFCERTVARLKPALRLLASEFPSIHVRLDDGEPHLRASDWWHADFDTWAFDCAIDELASDSFTLRVDGDVAFALEVMNRCQRHVGRRNFQSQGALFTHVLQQHRALYDLEKPLVRADYNHALDVWQWMLRLDPYAALSEQIAAIFHDVERLESQSILEGAGAGADVREEVAELIASYEQQPGLLGDADALSFFSLNSSGYADSFGPQQTRRKVASTWNRMNERARLRMTTIRLRPDVRAMLNEV